MFKFQSKAGFEPKYQTSLSSGADLHATIELVVPARAHVKVPTGVFIESVLDDGGGLTIPELQIRARSSLAYKHGITLSNGVGTIDADYRDEICVLLWNTSAKDYLIKKGDRIAQLVCVLTHRLTQCEIGGQRVGGFGSTDVVATASP